MIIYKWLETILVTHVMRNWDFEGKKFVCWGGISSL